MECLEQGHGCDPLTVGAIEQVIMRAFGIARSQHYRHAHCRAGDGASIMQMGNMAIACQPGCANLMHIVFNSAVRDSVEVWHMVGGAIGLPAIAASCSCNHEDSAIYKEIKPSRMHPTTSVARRSRRKSTRHFT